MSLDQQQTSEKYYKDKGYKAQDVALAIIGAGLANAIALVALNTPFSLWNTIVGIIILCILYAYAPAPTSSSRLNLAYAATWSISFLSTIAVIFNVIFSSLGALFPDYDSTAQFFPFPRNLNDFTNQTKDTFTPFNTYDGAFFLTWLAIFLICLWFLFLRRNQKRTQSASPQEQPKTVQPKPAPETLPANDSATPTTSGHLSDIPRSEDEVH